MAITKTDAVVLHTRKQGETSKILSLYSLQFGLMSVIAKGSRSLKSRFGGAINALNYISIVFYWKEERTLQFLSQADIIDAFPDIHRQLGKIALAGIACEMIEKNEAAGHNNPHLFRLLLDFLENLEKAQRGQRNLLRAFQLKYLDISGFRPVFNVCLACGGELSGDHLFFDYERGGYRCGSCTFDTGAGQRISAYALKMLNYLMNAPVTNATKVKVSAANGREMDDFILAYMRYHIEIFSRLVSMEYLEKLRRNFKN